MGRGQTTKCTRLITSLGFFHSLGLTNQSSQFCLRQRWVFVYAPVELLTQSLLCRLSQPIRPEVLYWRTSAGDEVDFVLESLGKLLAIEVKATRNPGYGDTKGLRVFLAEYPELAVGGLLLHDGRDVSWLGQRILAVPWWQVL